jgi:hypothetical protein
MPSPALKVGSLDIQLVLLPRGRNGVQRFEVEGVLEQLAGEAEAGRQSGKGGIDWEC